MRESDVLTADLVDAAGNAVRRLATERRVGPGRPLPSSPGTGARTTARSPPTARYRVRASLPRQGRSVIAPRLINLDTAPPPRVTAIVPGRSCGGETSQVVGPRAPAMAIYVRGISPPLRRRASACCARTPASRSSWRGQPRPRAAESIWNGRSGGRPVPAGHLRGRRWRSATAPATSAATRGPCRPTPRHSPAPGGITVRSLAAQPPLRPITAGKRAEFFVDAAGAPTAGRSAAGAASARSGAAASRAAAAGPLRLRAPQRQVRPLPARAESPAAPPRACRSSSSRASGPTLLVVVPALTWLGTDPVDDPPLRDGMPDTLDRRRRRSAGRGCSPADGLPDGLRAPGRAAAALPRPRAAPLRPHQRPRPRALDRAARERPQGRSAGRPAALGHAPAGAAPAPLRARRRPGRDVRRGDAAARGDAARPPRETAGALPPDAADRPGPVRREPAGAVRRSGRARAARASSPATPPHGLLTGTDGVLEGFGRLEESARRRPRPRTRRRSWALGQPPSEPDPDAPADQPLPEPAYALTADAPGRGARDPRRPARSGREAGGARGRAGHAQHVRPAAARHAADPLGPLSSEPSRPRLTACGRRG